MKLPLMPAWLFKAAGEPAGSGRRRFDLGGDGKIPHGQRHDYLISLAASVVSRTPRITPDQALAIVRSAVITVTDGDLWPSRDHDIEEAVRSAIRKFGGRVPGELRTNRRIEEILGRGA